MTRWYSEKKREHYYKQAKKNGYRARSAFKLLQIQKKFKIINKDDIVIDLGAAPGGWSQVAKKIVGKNGTVIGIDISPIKPINDINFIKADLTKKSTIEKLQEILENKKVDVILSDMAPDISGNYTVDHAKSIYLCEQALKVSEKILKKNGSFVCKVFDGEDLQNLIDKFKTRFITVKQFSPKASRKSSSEVYIISKLRQSS